LFKLVPFDKKNMIQRYCCDFSFTGECITSPCILWPWLCSITKSLPRHV